VDAIDRADLSTHNHRIALTMPGLGFGFAPRNYDGFVERIECPTCSKMMDLFDDATKPVELSPGDKERKAAYDRRRAWPLIGRFFPEPTYKSVAFDAEALFVRLDAIKAECSRHWGTEDARAIGEELMGNYIRADRLVHSSGSL
jgi:hypothetical protein